MLFVCQHMQRSPSDEGFSHSGADREDTTLSPPENVPGRPLLGFICSGFSDLILDRKENKVPGLHEAPFILADLTNIN
jgi:hypothetical protein